MNTTAQAKSKVPPKPTGPKISKVPRTDPMTIPMSSFRPDKSSRPSGRSSAEPLKMDVLVRYSRYTLTVHTPDQWRAIPSDERPETMEVERFAVDGPSDSDTDRVRRGELAQVDPSGRVAVWKKTGIEGALAYKVGIFKRAEYELWAKNTGTKVASESQLGIRTRAELEQDLKARIKAQREAEAR